jgi:hypothetical protein
MINIICIVPESTLVAIQQAIEDDTLPPEQAKAISMRSGSVCYRVFELNGERQYPYDILCEQADIEAMEGLDWTLIGMWDTETGELLSDFNEALYLECMPDIVTTNEEGEIVSTERPTVPRDLHLRAGQHPRFQI